jgi:phosphoglycolate phosphatase-like HAD superfamily hydrolase
MSIRAMLLDMDGTLVDAFAPIVYALNRTLAALGLPEMNEADIRRHTGRGESSIRALFGERRDEAIRLYLQFHDERLFELTPMPGAEPMLQWAKSAGLSVAVVTSKSQSRAEAQLTHLGWTPWIDYVVGLVDGRAQKPDPHTLYLACDYMGVAPGEAVMIGDGTADMQAAANAGCTALGLAHAFSCSELEAAGAERCFSSLTEVRQWLSTQIPTS